MSVGNGRAVCLCGRDNAFLSLLKWILGEFEEIDTVRQVDVIENLGPVLQSEAFDILAVDAQMVEGSLPEFARGLRDSMPLLGMIIFVSPTARDEVVEIISAKLADGVVIKPFTKEVVSNYVAKLLRRRTVPGRTPAP